MKIYMEDDFNINEFYDSYEIKKEIRLVSPIEIENILKACNNDKLVLKKWIRLIGVDCDDVMILYNNAMYRLDDKLLALSQLSSGQRIMLYIIACKKLEKKLVIHGLFERIGTYLRGVLDDVVYDYENLVILLYNSGPTEKLSKFMVEVNR